jgi:hypothetical protein
MKFIGFSPQECEHFTQNYPTHACLPSVYIYIVNCKSVTQPCRNVTWPDPSLTQKIVLLPSGVVPEGGKIESRSEHRYSGVIFLSHYSGMSERCPKIGHGRFHLPAL